MCFQIRAKHWNYLVIVTANQQESYWALPPGERFATAVKRCVFQPGSSPVVVGAELFDHVERL